MDVLESIVGQELDPGVRAHGVWGAARLWIRCQRPKGPRTIGVSDARAAFATLVVEVAQGRVRTIVARGHLAVAVIPAPEYDRLRALARVVSWFRGAGLDLASATEQQVIEFVRVRRGQTGGAQQAAG